LAIDTLIANSTFKFYFSTFNLFYVVVSLTVRFNVVGLLKLKIGTFDLEIDKESTM